MMRRLKTWLKDRFPPTESSPPQNVRQSGVYPSPRPKKPAVPKPVQKTVEDEPTLSGRIEDAGPGKNVLIRHEYIGDDTGTHETLKIPDDSLVDSEEEQGIDPYNSGLIDTSKSWGNRFRK